MAYTRKANRVYLRITCFVLLAFAVWFTGGARTLVTPQSSEPSDTAFSALDVTINYPSSVAISPTDVLYITTLLGGPVRVDLKTGLITMLKINAPLLPSVDQLRFNRDGHLLVTDYAACQIREIHEDGSMRTIAGKGRDEDGECQPSGDDGPAVEASFRPDFLALDRDDNIFILDIKNRQVRRIDAQSGTITTVAGSNAPDFSGDGSPAIKAGLTWPDSVAISGSGDLFISQLGKESKGHTIRRVAAGTGVITALSRSSFAGHKSLDTELRSPRHLFADALGNLYVLEHFRLRYLDFARILYPPWRDRKQGWWGWRAS